MKYALSGAAGAASRAIAGMPERWRAALAGEGEVDLRAVTRLSPCTHVWTTPGVLSRLAALGASKVLRTPPQRLESAGYPEAFSHPPAPRGVDVYRVDEPVLDAASLARVLVAEGGGEGEAGGVGGVGVVRGIAGARAVGAGVELDVDTGVERVRVACRHVVLAAGAGNTALRDELAALAPPEARMQTRPLHMVLVRGPLPPLFGHCLGASSLPRMTVTSWDVPSEGGEREPERVWYVGGQVAESGVARDEPAQIEAARRELAACLSWIDLSRARFACVRYERAEGLTASGQRPDVPIVHTSPLVTMAWPSKLALAPLMADQVIEHVMSLGLAGPGREGGGGGTGEPANGPWPGPAPRPPVLPWETAQWLAA